MPPDALPARQAVASGKGGPSDEQVRQGALEGILIAVGEMGYRDASVRAILEHSGGHRAQFYRHFESKEDCFAQAYASWVDRLCVDLLEAAASAPGWQAGVRAALIELFRFVSDHPAIARALFVEVHIAGEPALSRHEAATERAAAALDGVRAEIEPELAPPEATGAFVVGGIESCVCEALTAGDPARIWDALPELMHLAVGSYFDREAAEAAFEEASEMLARDRAKLTGGAG
jgi:AcrR family transcriptional regulator